MRLALTPYLCCPPLPDPSFGLSLKDGQVLECSVAHALGSLDHPMSDAQLESKFLTYAGAVIGAERAACLSDLCWQLPTLKDLGELAAMASA